MHVNWTALWLRLFGTTELLGLNMGFWVSMGIALLVALLMVIVFWAQKPFGKSETKEKEEPGQVTPRGKRHQK